MNATDLDSAEVRRARERLFAMADEFAAKGVLRSPELRAAFERTWRHPYVPAYYPDPDGPPVLCIDGDRRAEWLDAVYSNTTLITKIVRVPMSRALRPATANVYTSSSTLPILVVWMIEDLALSDGHRVLELGTGTGYNAAVLCARLGDGNVTTVDIDAELVELARERLAANGHRPTVAAVDGAEGYPANAPYDRILATCSVRSIPRAWLDQAAPGAIILTDVHDLIGGTVARLSVDANHTATGRFVAYSTGFMPLRHETTITRDRASLLAGPVRTGWTGVDPQPMTVAGAFSFVTQWHLQGMTYGYTTDADDRPALEIVADDGSHVEITLEPEPQGFRVREVGDRSILSRLEEANKFWLDNGKPSSDRFGITATSSNQYVWFDNPDGPRWQLIGD